MKAASARVLLTGAAGGIGRATSARLRAAGAEVLGVGRGPAPDAMRWVRADLTTDEGRAATVAVADAFGANVVVHAAGVPGFGPLAAVPPERLQAIVATNLVAPMLLTQALLPSLLRREHAQVVFVGSALGRIGMPGFSVYGAGKGGLHLFAEALRRELAGTSVRIQLLGPRSTRTAFNDPAVEAFNRATGAAADPPEVVADALLALIESGSAERFVGFPERLAVRLNGAFGAVLDGAFTKHRRHLNPIPTRSAEEPTT